MRYQSGIGRTEVSPETRPRQHWWQDLALLTIHASYAEFPTDFSVSHAMLTPHYRTACSRYSRTHSCSTRSGTSAFSS